MLTELWIEEYGRVKSTASLTGGGAGAALAEGVLWRFSGRLDSAGRLVVCLRWNQGSQCGPKCSGSAESPWCFELTGADRLAIPGHVEGRGRNWRLGDAPGVEADPVRGSAGLGSAVWRGHGGARLLRNNGDAARWLQGCGGCGA